MKRKLKKSCFTWTLSPADKITANANWIKNAKPIKKLLQTGEFNERNVAKKKGKPLRWRLIEKYLEKRARRKPQLGLVSPNKPLEWGASEGRSDLMSGEVKSLKFWRSMLDKKKRNSFRNWSFWTFREILAVQCDICRCTRTSGIKHVLGRSNLN